MNKHRYHLGQQVEVREQGGWVPGVVVTVYPYSPHQYGVQTDATTHVDLPDTRMRAA